jgi:dTDP-4-dehydrorhamnose 3,5-epimerase-like enzyme
MLESLNMKVISTAIPDVLILEPEVFGDSRGFFFESFDELAFRAARADIDKVHHAANK